MSIICIRNLRILDPSQGMDQSGDLAYEREGAILWAGGRYDGPVDEEYDGAGLCAAPGLVDMHVHLRDPGFTHKEDLFTGCRAAAAGGFTGVVCMPNTKPPVDSPETVRYIVEKAAYADARVYPVATITKGMAGQELSDYTALKAAGAVAVSDDGKPVANAAVMQRGMEAAYAQGLPVVSHCEDLDIIAGGIIHKGAVSEELGVKGMDRSSEDSITAREIALAAATGTAIHICHVSTAGSAALIRDAKARGVRVTCETAPHYLLLTHEELRRRDANWRMNPPLREEADRLAMLEAVADGTVDAIITDHAPHSPEEKADFDTAPNGIIGLETSFAASYTALVESGRIPLLRLVELMSTAPCRLLGLPGGTLQPGVPADVVLFDPAETWTLQAEHIRSKARNTPFIGTTFTGRVRATLLGGRVTFQAEQ